MWVNPACRHEHLSATNEHFTINFCHSMIYVCVNAVSIPHFLAPFFLALSKWFISESWPLFRFSVFIVLRCRCISLFTSFMPWKLKFFFRRRRLLIFFRWKEFSFNEFLLLPPLAAINLLQTYSFVPVVTQKIVVRKRCFVHFILKSHTYTHCVRTFFTWLFIAFLKYHNS